MLWSKDLEVWLRKVYTPIASAFMGINPSFPTTMIPLSALWIQTIFFNSTDENYERGGLPCLRSAHISFIPLVLLVK